MTSGAGGDRRPGNRVYNAADVLIGVDCCDPLLNFRVRGLASAVRGVAGGLDAVLVADDKLFARHLGASAE